MTIRTRLFSLLMAVIMVISLMPMSVLAADEHVHNEEALATTVEEAAAAPSAEDAPEAAVCTCESDDPASHAPFCALYAAPEAPVCFCVEQCAEGSVNEWCDVCYFDSSACDASGEEEAAVYAATPTYIASIGIAQDGSKGSDGVNDCKAELSGHTIIDRDLNDGAGGDYVYMGYKTTTDPSKAITGILFRVGENPPERITDNGKAYFYLVGKGESNTASEGGYIDLNARAGGVYIYMYVTRDPSYGAPLTDITVDESSSKSGYSTGTNTSGNVIDLNQGADGDYLYLHYKRFSATVNATYYYLDAGGSCTSSTQSATVKNHLETLTKVPSYPTSVTYDGRTFTFKGWREDNTADAATVTSPSVTYITGDKTYRAVYAADVNLSYDANGGSGAPAAQTAIQYINAGYASTVAKQSVKFTIPNSTYTHDSKCFLGWSTNRSATTVTYQPGGTISIDSNKTLYAVYADHSYSGGICDHCGEYSPGSVAVLSKNGEPVFAGNTLDAVITEAEKCTESDKAVVTILQDIDLGSNYQQIDSGTFTIDLNGCKLSYDNSMYATLRLYNSGTDITLISSRTGGTVENRHYIGEAINTYGNANLTATGISVIAGSEGNGILLNDGNASLTDVTVQAGVGIWVRLLHTQNKPSLTCTNCTVQATFRALRVGDGTATITGGRLQGDICDIDSFGTTLLALDENGVGTTFSSGINVDGNKRLNNILADGAAYWAGDTMLSIGDDVKSITDKGDITVKAACTHESGKQSYTNNGDDHTYVWSCCKLEVTEEHTFTDTKCVCGARDHDCVYTNGFCEKGCYEPAELVDGYYQIGNGGQMFWFANHINTVDRTASAKLTADIDLENRAWTPIGSTGEGSNNFRGHFDGQGHTIEGLQVTAKNSGGGFFGEVRLGTVENFTIKGTVTVAANITYVGGVIGSAPGANGENVPDHNGATIRNITSYVNVTVLDGLTGVGRIGGFMGYANHETLIENCAWYGTIDLGNQTMNLGAGGFIGRVNEKSAVTIRNCGAYGSIVNDSVTENVGAFMGLTNTESNTVIENCLFAGGVSGSKASSVTPFGTWNGASKTLKNSYYINTLGTTDADAVKVTAEQLASGEVAYLLGDAFGQTIGTDTYPVPGGAKVYSVTNCKNEVVRYSNTDETIGHDWSNGKCTVCGYECKHSFVDSTCTVCGKGCVHSYTSGKCTICGYECTSHTYTNGFCTTCDDYEPAELVDDGYYEIGNAGQLYWFAKQVNSGNKAINGRLTNNIVINENVLKADGTLNNGSYRAWNFIGSSSSPYGGTFDGQNHTVSGLYTISNVSGKGLFGTISASGTVQNVGVIDSYIYGLGNVGGVAAENAGTIINCYFMGRFNGGNFTGGVVGENSGTVTNCYSSGRTSTVMGYGGVAHRNTGTVTNCYYNSTLYNGRAIYNNNGGTATNVEGKTTEQFKSGEVAYLLQRDQTEQVWGQTIGTEDYPVLGGAKVYHGDTHCGDNVVLGYTNTETPAHNWSNSVCTVCSKVCEHAYEDGVCTECGKKCTEHTFENCICTVCGVINHSYNNGICTDCGEYEPAKLVNDYYEISNAGQLYWFAKQVNDGQTTINGKLTKNIVVNENVLNDDGNLNDGTFRSWTPIGNINNHYTGTFEGNEFTVSGLYVNVNTAFVGLFGRIGSGTVRNMGVVDSYIRGADHVGGVAGYNNSGIVENCYNAGNVSGYSVGGVVGQNNGTVVNSYNSGSISGTTANGGVVGFNYGTIKNCYNTGTVTGFYDVGGVLSSNIGTVENCYNTGTVTGISNVGGVAGFNDINGTVTNCYNNSDVFSGESIGDNYGTAVDVLNKTGAQFASGEVAYLLQGEQTQQIWGQNVDGEGEKDPYPIFSEVKVYPVSCCLGKYGGYSNTEGKQQTAKYNENGFCIYCGGYEPAHGNGTEADPYLISNAGQLYWFAAVVNTRYGDEARNESAWAELTANITVNEAVLKDDGSLNDGTFRAWTPIAAGDVRYFGTFDGNGFAVSGLYFHDTTATYAGLFGILEGDAVVRNVGVVDSYIIGSQKVGAVAGTNMGTVEDCYNAGTVIVGDGNVGGLVGENVGPMTNCYNTGTVSGSVNVGGVTGYNGGSMTNCYNAGHVRGKIENIGGKIENIGGVTGFNVGSITNCYYDSYVYSGEAFGSNYGTAANVEGKSTEQFKSGEVAYLLGEAFGQTIGTDVSPVLGGKKVYCGYTDCDDVKDYSNNSAIAQEKPNHDWSNSDGVCVDCGYECTEHDYRSGYCLICDKKCENHSLENGACIICGRLLFYGTNVTLGNELDLNFAVEKALLPEGAYGEINGTKVEWTPQIEPNGIELMLLTYSGLAAKEMGTVVTATVYDKDGKLLVTREDSIQSYAMRSLESHFFNINAKPLLIKMLDYGAAAQVEFDYDTEHLVNAEITEDMRNTYPAATRTSKILNPAIGDLYMGTSLILENAIEMQMGFKGTPEGITATVSYTDHYGKAQTYENADLRPYTDKNTGEVVAYGVVIPGIVVADGRQAVTVTVYKDGAELIKVTDSIASYVARNNSEGIYGAIMDFSDAAHTYLHTKGA